MRVDKKTDVKYVFIEIGQEIPQEALHKFQAPSSQLESENNASNNHSQANEVSLKSSQVESEGARSNFDFVANVQVRPEFLSGDSFQANEKAQGVAATQQALRRAKSHNDL